MIPKKDIEKQTAHSFSMRDKEYEEFQTWCYNNETTPAREIRNFILNFLKEKDGENGIKKK